MKYFITNNIEVRIYNTKRGMRRHLRNIGYNPKHIESMVIPITHYIFKDGKTIKSPLIAEMVLHENITLPVLVHEVLHAATSVIRRSKKSVDLGRRIRLNEERLAYTQTAILQDILKHFFPKKNSNYDLTDVEWWASRSIKSNQS